LPWSLATVAKLNSTLITLTKGKNIMITAIVALFISAIATGMFGIAAGDRI
jgi:hypothetical protein